MLAGEFFDSDIRPDEELARILLDGENIQSLSRLVADCERLISRLDQHWEVFSEVVNRHFENADQARSWLLRMLAVWEPALRQMDRKKPS